MNIQGYSPLMNAPIQSQAATSGTSGSSGTSGTSGTSGSSGSDNGLSSTDLQTTFLNLLVTELQNQDPTQPVDPTEMVSQMVSLNQLDQLISINQTLTSLTTPPSTSGTGATGQATGATTPVGAATTAAPTFFGATGNNAIQPGIPGGVPPGTLMNLYGNMSSPANNSNFAIPGGR